jgi:hypothetical protein
MQGRRRKGLTGLWRCFTFDPEMSVRLLQSCIAWPVAGESDPQRSALISPVRLAFSLGGA